MDVARAARLRLLVAAALFSTGGALIKAVTLTAWQVSAFRSGVGALALLVLAPEARRRFTRRTWLVGLAYAGTVTLFVLANRTTTAANAIFLQSTAPLYLLLLGPLLLREPVRRADLGFLAVIALGMAAFFLGTEPARATAPDPALGNLLAAASGLCWALTILGLRWLGRDGDGGASAAVAGNVLGCLVALPFALRFGMPVAASAPTDWALVAFLGVVQIGVSYVLVTRATRHVPALEATLLLLLEPVLNPVLAWVVHGETPGAWSLLGGALIVGATTVRALSYRRPAPGTVGG